MSFWNNTFPLIIKQAPAHTWNQQHIQFLFVITFWATLLVWNGSSLKFSIRVIYLLSNYDVSCISRQHPRWFGWGFSSPILGTIPFYAVGFCSNQSAYQPNLVNPRFSWLIRLIRWFITGLKVKSYSIVALQDMAKPWSVAFAKIWFVN